MDDFQSSMKFYFAVNFQVLDLDRIMKAGQWDHLDRAWF